MTEQTTNEAVTGALDRPPAGRPWYTRWTVVGGILLGGALASSQIAEQQGIVPNGFVTLLNSLIKDIGGMLALFGIYRHVANE